MAGGNIPSQLAPVFQQASAKYGIPANVLAGVASVESNFNNAAVSPVGAQGITQFMPGTARQEGVNVKDPASEIMGTARYLAQLGFHQNPTKALASYNAGPGNYQAGLGYAKQVLSEAQRLAPQVGSASSSGSSSVNLPPLTAGQLPALTQEIPTFDQAGYDKAQKGYVLGQFLKGQAGQDPWGNKGGSSALGALFQAGVLSTQPPSKQDFQGTRTVQLAHNSLVQLAGTQLNLHPALRAGTVAAGFLPKGATYIKGRQDQGRDGQTNPGGPILANGDGVVVNVLSDPSGFGPKYPVVHFTSGPYAGKTLYFGHTLATVQPGQKVRAGQVLSYTGKGPGGIGNASVPGWFEIGYANSGSPGPNGQPAPF